MFIKVWKDVHVDHMSVVMISKIAETDRYKAGHVLLDFDVPGKSLELPPGADYDETVAALSGLCAYSTAWSDGEDDETCLQHNTPRSKDFEDRGANAPCESAVYRKLPSVNLPRERTPDEGSSQEVRGLYL